MPISSDFIRFIDAREYAPEPWCHEQIMKARNWIFDQFDECIGERSEEASPTWRSQNGRPPWWHKLSNVQAGLTNSIDNCVGEFTNYHHAIAEFMQTRHPRCSILFQEGQWGNDADHPSSKQRNIVFTINSTPLSIPRLMSTFSRQNEQTLNHFLTDMDGKISNICK